MAYRVTKIRRNLNQGSLSDSSSEEGEKQSDRIVGLIEEHEVAPEIAEAVAAVQAVAQQVAEQQEAGPLCAPPQPNFFLGKPLFASLEWFTFLFSSSVFPGIL